MAKANLWVFMPWWIFILPMALVYDEMHWAASRLDRKDIVFMSIA